jgi:ribosomal protein S18 acetylase RimI-like enzyme
MPPDAEGSTVRVASSEADLAVVTETISLAFHEDPTWSWAFPDPNVRQEQYSTFWRFVIKGAMRYPWVFLSGDGAAASVWIPPEGTELSTEDEEKLGPLLEDLVGPRAGEVVELLERFEEARPKDRPHYYLSLLGTHPAHAGRGHGFALLTENLRRIDELGMPAYLESSNPANNHRYERYGFAKLGEFYPPTSTTPITTMWRDAR